MKALMRVALAGLLMGATAWAADPPTAGRAEQEHTKQAGRSADRPKDAGPLFSAREVEVIREYYAPRYRSLPPGLQKKLRRTGHLPPGWEKRLEPFPAVVERQLVVLAAGYRRGVIDGHAVIYNPSTQIIIDVAVLF